MINPRSEHIYTLFIDYLLHGRMNIDDCLSIMRGFNLGQDYEAGQGVYNALLDYVCLIPLEDFK